ncbi:MAG: zinc-binding dehydrogenase [Armatimonadia bacterium]
MSHHDKHMQAAVLVEPGKMELQEAPVPEAGAGQIRVKLQGCGVCASNLPPFEGREWFTYPFQPGQLGHEGWGVIDQVGEGVSGLEKGQRVSILSDHAYAEYDVTDAAKAVALPDVLEGHSFPGEPLGCAMNIFRRSDLHSGQTVAIVGIGFLGALLTELASKSGATVFAIARRPFAQSIARQMGAAEVIPMDDHWKIIEKVKELTGQVMCDRVIEAVGKQWPLDLAAELTREMGRLIIAGYHQDGMRQVNMQLWNWRGLDVINAHERQTEVYIRGISEAVQAVTESRLTPEPLYTHQFPLKDLQQALEMTRDRPDGFFKALVRM